MPRFPTREADVASLANRIISGLREHAEDFPNPPHAADRLQASADAFEASYDAAVLAQGAAAQALEERVASLEAQVAELWQFHEHANAPCTTVPAELVGNEHMLEEEVATTWPQQKGIDPWS